MNQKDRRHNGWVYPPCTIRMPKKWIIDNCLEPQPYWDDWTERRDGQRDRFNDYKKIKITHYDCEERQRMNRKQLFLIRRRKARRSHPRNLLTSG